MSSCGEEEDKESRERDRERDRERKGGEDTLIGLPG